MKQKKGKHQPIWVSGDAPMPAGCECSQLSLFLSLASVRSCWLDFVGSQDYSDYSWKGPGEII